MNIPTVPPSCWWQPKGSFPTWKGRGVQLIYGEETEGVNSPDAFAAYVEAMRLAGLKGIFGPKLKAWWNDDVCLGVFIPPDEPDGAGNQTPDQVKATSDAIRAVTTKDRYITLNAGALLSKPDAVIAAYCACAEKIGFFSYSYNFGLGPAGVLGEVGPSLDKLHRLAPGKSIFFIGECGDQDMKSNNFWKTQPRAAQMRPPSGDEMAFEYGVALAHGANGLMYFSQKLGPGWEGFDSTTPDCEVVMKNLNALYVQPALVVVATGLQVESFTFNGVKYALAK